MDWFRDLLMKQLIFLSYVVPRKLGGSMIDKTVHVAPPQVEWALLSGGKGSNTTLKLIFVPR